MEFKKSKNKYLKIKEKTRQKLIFDLFRISSKAKN